MLKQRLKT